MKTGFKNRSAQQRAYCYVFIISMLTACTASHKTTVSTASSDFVANSKLFTAVWMQKAAEYKALCEQAYNIAYLRLDEYIRANTSDKKLAVITDIDETLLDNSAYAVHRALRGKDYDNVSWDDWVSRAAADTIPGALNFFRNAAAKNVSVFYVTNRNNAGRSATLSNLVKFGFPDADEQHLVTMANTSSKEARRLEIERSYNVVLFIGDNLADFSALFDKKNADERAVTVTANKEEFGKRFIILPNPNYGDWESALYQFNYKLTPAQKDSVWKASARDY
ncbi:MAG: 5'-nucleotidase, lipoprotein e(P4) family [Niabella sp.]